jgi:hypothetical protein
MVDVAAMIEERSTKWMQAWVKKGLAVQRGSVLGKSS